MTIHLRVDTIRQSGLKTDRLTDIAIALTVPLTLLMIDILVSDSNNHYQKQGTEIQT